MSENIFNLKIFKWIDKNVVEEIILNTPEKTFNPWEIIFLQWEKSNWEAYIIKSWKVEVILNWKQIAILKEWDIVWEIALLNEEERTATVKAIEETTVLILNLDNLIEIINNDNNTINNTVIERIEENIKNSWEEVYLN